MHAYATAPRATYARHAHALRGAAVPPARVAYPGAKRFMDVLLTLAFFPFIGTALLLCALAVRIDSRGPVFCRELRIGVGGRRFGLWRLRTTREDPEGTQDAGVESGALSLPRYVTNNSRLTRVGRFLRKTHLEDLPQLFNVLRGDMSLVGPRPARVVADRQPLWYTERFEAKPGITGLAQLTDQARSDADLRVRLDIAYIRHRTIALDTKILLRSVGVAIGTVPDVIAPAVRPALSYIEFFRPAPRTAAPLPFRRYVSIPQLGAFAVALGDIVAAGVALAAAYVLRFMLDVGGREILTTPPPIEYVQLFVLLGATISVIASLQQLYRINSPYSTLEETYAVAKAVTLATGIGLAIAFFYRNFEYSRLTLAYFWFFAVVLSATSHAVYRKWLLDRYARGIDLQSAVVVGSPSAHLLDRLRSDPAFGINLVGWLGPADDLAMTGPEVLHRPGMLLGSAKTQAALTFSPLPRLGGIDDAPAVIARSNIERVIIVEYGLSHAQLLETIDACEQRKVAVHLVPPIYDLLIDPTDLSVVNGIPTLRIDEARDRWSQEAVKRIFDIVVSSLLLLILAPLMLAIAVAIRKTSAGPALFRQRRAGRHGRAFEMLKFRTMVRDAEERLASVLDIDRLAQPVFKITNDPRITPVGKWLRRFSLDELPQLVNVLKGEMTLVGPRPEEMKIVQKYDVWQRRRLKMKPGITGLQQVVARGSLSDLTDRVRLDMYYTRKQSFVLDLVILGRTVGAVMSGRGAT